MSQNNNNTPPKVPPVLTELNNLVGEMFLNRRKGVRLKEVDKYLDDKENSPDSKENPKTHNE